MAGTHGGARPGAGRKPKPKEPPAQVGLTEPTDDPLEYLMSVVNDPAADPRLRVRAAVAAAQYKHVKAGDGGKKEQLQAAAEQAATGRFAPAAPPKLAAVK